MISHSISHLVTFLSLPISLLILFFFAQVLGDKIGAKTRCMALEIQGKKNNVYAPELQSTFRHKLKPGPYIVVPSTVDEGQEKAFLLRLFTSAPLQNIR